MRVPKCLTSHTNLIHYVFICGLSKNQTVTYEWSSTQKHIVRAGMKMVLNMLNFLAPQIIVTHIKWSIFTYDASGILHKFVPQFFTSVLYSFIINNFDSFDILRGTPTSPSFTITFTCAFRIGIVIIGMLRPLRHNAMYKPNDSMSGQVLQFVQ